MARAFALALIGAALLAPVLTKPVLGKAAETPQRVVSMNLCTDQLAMMIAAPGQLVSVSFLAQDPSSSVLHEEAQAYHANHGLAEEIFLLKPDMVIAGTYTTRVTIAMLRRLGIPVVEVAQANNFADISDRISQMGKILGREIEAEALRLQFEQDLKQLNQTASDQYSDTRYRAALYYANSYTAGEGTLAHSVLKVAGLSNIASELGFKGGSHLPLEVLLMQAPDLVVEGQRYEAPAMANDVLDHPALVRAKADAAGSSKVADSQWVCGTPHILAAVRNLIEALPESPGPSHAKPGAQ